MVDTSAWSNGTKSLTARAFDAAGNTATSDVVTVTVGMMGDVSPPTVSITAPTMNAMTGLSVTVTADAMDDVGVTRVEFELDGTPVGSATATPYLVMTSVSAGAHSVVAIAFDASGKFTRSTPVAFTAVGPDDDGGMPPDAGTQPVDAGQQEPDAGTTQPTAGGSAGREGKQELVIGGCGCSGGGVGLWSVLAIVFARRFRRRSRLS